MEGPTPVSALIHAATMVTAGVYMVARSSADLRARAASAHDGGGAHRRPDRVLRRHHRLVQNDIKRVLAYSTVSQLGYMFLACGVGAFAAGVFHLMTHAFFKALLFLGSGSVIHAHVGRAGHAQDGRPASAKLPWTHRTMLIGCIAIAGIPPLAGFFSKDEILWSAYKIGGYGTLRVGDRLRVGGLTAFYMFRLYHMTFSGELPRHRGAGAPRPRVAAHDDPAPAGAGRGLDPGRARSASPPSSATRLHIPNVFEHFLEPVFEAAHHALPQVFTRRAAGAQHRDGAHGGRASPVAALGIVLARLLLSGAIRRCRAAWRRPSRPSTALLLNKYYVDELYGAVFVRGAALGGGAAPPRGRPLRRRRRRRRGAARARRERPRLGDARRAGEGSRTSGTATSWTAPST